MGSDLKDMQTAEKKRLAEPGSVEDFCFGLEFIFFFLLLGVKHPGWTFLGPSWAHKGGLTNPKIKGWNLNTGFLEEEIPVLETIIFSVPS